MVTLGPLGDCFLASEGKALCYELFFCVIGQQTSFPLEDPRVRTQPRWRDAVMLYKWNEQIGSMQSSLSVAHPISWRCEALAGGV